MISSRTVQVGREGLLERADDPCNRSAKTVRFTPAGEKSLLDGPEVLRWLEGELGVQRMAALRDILRRLVGLL